MQEKMREIDKLARDLKRLRDEYNAIRLWGEAPDGDVCFERLIQWLAENEPAVREMIDAAKKIHDF